MHVYIVVLYHQNNYREKILNMNFDHIVCMFNLSFSMFLLWLFECRKAHIAISEFRGQESSAKRTHKINGQKEQGVQVLLLLIQHGANGLNLLEAQHVVLVEPLLNPAAEAQAISRVHRIGQENKTLVHRFIVSAFSFMVKSQTYDNSEYWILVHCSISYA